ncbi:MAG: 30S ribosomal protein S6, partial [Myxococcales bacterium]
MSRITGAGPSGQDVPTHGPGPTRVHAFSPDLPAGDRDASRGFRAGPWHFEGAPVPRFQPRPAVVSIGPSPPSGGGSYLGPRYEARPRSFAVSGTRTPEGVRPRGGSVREFETTFIVQPEITDEGLQAIRGRLDAVLARHGAVRLMCDDLGRKRLAYEIRKFQKGHYLELLYLDHGAVVPEVERALRLDDSVLRFLT